MDDSASEATTESLQVFARRKLIFKRHRPTDQLDVYFAHQAGDILGHGRQLLSRYPENSRPIKRNLHHAVICAHHPKNASFLQIGGKLRTARIQLRIDGRCHSKAISTRKLGDSCLDWVGLCPLCEPPKTDSWLGDVSRRPSISTTRNPQKTNCKNDDQDFLTQQRARKKIATSCFQRPVDGSLSRTS